MTVVAKTDDDFAFLPLGGDITDAPDAAVTAAAQVLPSLAGPLGALADLPGTWKGEGFNTIWRPHNISGGSGQDRFLELNLTSETITFTEIKGAIPNRGLLMPDISLHGLTYMQQISERGNNAQGLHIEPGIWAHVPQTSNPAEPRTVVRMASIPHGTTILAQGRATVLTGKPDIPDTNIIPFGVGTPPPLNSAFGAGEAAFPELNLAQPTPFRFESPGVDQEMVKNPNSVLQQAISGQDIERTVAIFITTNNAPIKGGGTANTAFLESATFPPGGNAKCVEMTATFWIETVKGAQGHPDTLQLQYSQLVQLDFNGLRWPHITVSTLRKQ